MTEQYRFGGSIPESVQRLKKRREWRASGLFATVKRGHREARATAVTSAANTAIERAVQRLRAAPDKHPAVALEPKAFLLVSSNPPDPETNGAPQQGLQLLEQPVKGLVP